MFYVMRKSKKKPGRWAKTMFGARSGLGGSASDFKGIPLKCDADAALEYARKKWPNCIYRLIYSEEEL